MGRACGEALAVTGTLAYFKHEKAKKMLRTLLESANPVVRAAAQESLDVLAELRKRY